MQAKNSNDWHLIRNSKIRGINWISGTQIILLSLVVGMSNTS